MKALSVKENLYVDLSLLLRARLVFSSRRYYFFFGMLSCAHASWFYDEEYFEKESLNLRYVFCMFQNNNKKIKLPSVASPARS